MSQAKYGGKQPWSGPLSICYSKFIREGSCRLQATSVRLMSGMPVVSSLERDASRAAPDEAMEMARWAAGEVGLVAQVVRALH